MRAHQHQTAGPHARDDDGYVMMDAAVSIGSDGCTINSTNSNGGRLPALPLSVSAGTVGHNVYTPGHANLSPYLGGLTMCNCMLSSLGNLPPLIRAINMHVCVRELGKIGTVMFCNPAFV